MNTEELKEYFAARQEVLAAYLFGSRAEGVARSDSDLDVAVLLNQEAQEQATLGYRLAMADELEKRTHLTVDLVLLRQASLLLQFQVFKYGKLIFEQDPVQQATYQMITMCKYYDYRRFFDFHSKHLHQRIKERGLGFGHAGD